MSENTYACEFNVDGMHCAACELLVEKKLSAYKGVKKVDANLDKHKVKIEFESEVDSHKVMKEMSGLIEPNGYKLTDKLEKRSISLNDLIYAALISSVIILLFVALQKLNIVNLVDFEDLSYPFVFLIGFVASVSTCMAVVGGLVLSLSSTYAKGKSFAPMVAFHLSRILGFFLLGGLMGIIGSAFTLNSTTQFIINIILFIVMLIMGVSLLDIFDWTNTIQPKMPKFIGKSVLNLADSKNNLLPIVLGTATFFLPCGFTQSMQIYALETGSFVDGALLMFVFALGTFPVLAGISFASNKFANISKTNNSIFFKTAGFIVIFFAIFNFLAALTAVGI